MLTTWADLYSDVCAKFWLPADSDKAACISFQIWKRSVLNIKVCDIQQLKNDLLSLKLSKSACELILITVLALCQQLCYPESVNRLS